MEKLSTNPEQNTIENLRKNLLERDLTIARLTGELEDARQTPPQIVGDPALEQKYLAQGEELQNLKKEAFLQISTYREQVGNLNESLQKTRDDYQNLRKQKGGFGFVAMILCGFFSTVVGFALHWLFFRQPSNHAEAFQKFRDDNQFNIEYDISQGKFDKIEADLKAKQEDNKLEAIHPEIEFLRKIMGATRRKFSKSGIPKVGADGFSVNPEIEEIDIQQKAKKSLTITEAEVTIRSEASSSGEKLGKIKKDETAGVWDRTNSLDKLTLTVDNNRCEVSDYWYKIETKDGLEGWVFGYFTNRSLNRVILLGDPLPPGTLPSVPTTTDPAKPTESSLSTPVFREKKADGN